MPNSGIFGMFAAAVEAFAAAPGPAHRHRHRTGDHIARLIGARAFVEGHDDVGPQQALDLHRAFGREHVPRSVEMAGERDAFLGDLAQVRQAHDLIAAAVGQDRAVPAHEFVQPAQPRHALRAGAQHQVIGIAQDDVRPGGAHVFHLHRLDRCRRAHGHERRGADFPRFMVMTPVRALPLVAWIENEKRVMTKRSA
jgi:hypothetical protein